MASASAPSLNAPDRRLQQALENLLAELHKAIRAVSFYPPGHPILGKIHETSYEYIAKAAKYFSQLTLEIGRTQITYNELSLGAGSDVIRSLCQHLYRRRTKRLIFLAGVSMDEFQVFAEAAALDPEELYLRGGMETILVEHGVRHLWANQMDFERLRRRSEAAEGEKPDEGGDSGAQQQTQGLELSEQHDEPDSAGVFDDTQTLGESLASTQERPQQTPQHEALDGVLPILDTTTDTDQYFEGIRLVIELAQFFVREHDWDYLVRIVSRLQAHSADPARGVEFKKYSYRALRTIGTPEVIRGLLTELVTEGRTYEEIASLLRILTILGPAAVDVIIKRISYFKTPYQRNLIEQALYHSGGAEKLIPLLSSEDKGIVALVLRVMGRAKPAAAVEPIGRLAHSEDEMLRSEAVRALLKIRNAEALNALYDLLPSGNEATRGHILRAFGLYREVRAVPVLLNMLKLEKEMNLGPELRDTVFRTLGRIGGEDACTGLLNFIGEKRLWRRKYDDDFLAGAIIALGDAADREGLGQLMDMKFKGEKLRSAQVAAVRRAQERLQGGAGQ